MDWKNLLLDQLNRVYSELTASIDGLDPELVVHADTGWRLQDVLGHLAVWYEERTMSLQAWLQGEEYRIKAYKRDSYNQQAYERRRDWVYGEVFAEWQQAHSDLISVLREVPSNQFDSTIVYPWGESGTVAHLIERMIIHEREHQQEIRDAAS